MISNWESNAWCFVHLCPVWCQDQRSLLPSCSVLSDPISYLCGVPLLLFFTDSRVGVKAGNSSQAILTYDFSKRIPRWHSIGDSMFMIIRGVRGWFGMQKSHRWEQSLWTVFDEKAVTQNVWVSCLLQGISGRRRIRNIWHEMLTRKRRSGTLYSVFLC